MDIQTSKAELIRMIADIESSELINKVKKMILSDKKDFWDELSKEEKIEIELGIDDLNNGNRISYEDFLKKGF